MATTARLRSLSAAVALLLASATSLAAPPAPIVHDLSIPTQPLSEALKALSAAANEQLLFSQDLVAGKQSVAVSGAYTTDQALNLLLAGSGLKADRTPSGVLLIRDTSQAKLLRMSALATGEDE